MKKQDITYQDKINELRLDISHPNTRGVTLILVEGETDIRLFRKFFNLKNAKVECIPGGNSKVEEGVNELLNVYKLVIGLRDADFIHLNAVPYSKPNMFITDLHDIEMTLVSTAESFNVIILEYTNFLNEDCDSIKSHIIQSIEQVSLLKWLNDVENLEIQFEAGFQDLISFTDLNIDFESYFNRVLSKSPNAKIKSLEEIITKINILKNKNPDALQLCNGHDFIKAFSQYLREKGKTNNVSDEMISSMLRMNFSHICFSNMSLFQSTKLWADNKQCSFHL
jgi:hypothetical protein